MNSLTYDEVDEQLERISIALGSDGDWELIEEREAVDLLDQPTDENRKALLLAVAIQRETHRDPGPDLICMLANYYESEPIVILCGLGWTPRPGNRITPQQTIALRLAQFVLAEISWEGELGELAH